MNQLSLQLLKWQASQISLKKRYRFFFFLRLNHKKEYRTLILYILTGVNYKKRKMRGYVLICIESRNSCPQIFPMSVHSKNPIKCSELKFPKCDSPLRNKQIYIIKSTGDIPDNFLYHNYL